MGAVSQNLGLSNDSRGYSSLLFGAWNNSVNVSYCPDILPKTPSKKTLTEQKQNGKTTTQD
jgi:hypothetical protein